MHWSNWFYAVVIGSMPIIMVLMARRVTEQRKRQNDLLERIATALEKRT